MFRGRFDPFDRTPLASVVVLSPEAGKQSVLIRGYMPFSKLGLSDKVLAAVKAAG
jgi:hypothetical protein